MRRDPPLTSNEAPKAGQHGAATPLAGQRVNPEEPRSIPIPREPRVISSEPRPVVPDPRASFDPRNEIQQRAVAAAANEPRAAMQEPRPVAPAPRPVAEEQRPRPAPTAAVLPQLDDAVEAALRDISADPALLPPQAKPEADAGNRGRAGNKARQANKERQGGKPEKEERRANRQRRREAKDRNNAVSLPATTTGRALDEQFEEPVRKRDSKAKTKPQRQWGIPWTAISFTLMVLIPAAIATFYYLFLASPQFQVESQFSVRGSSQTSIATLGLPMIGGSSAQSGDSYIVASYVESLQLVRDVQEELGIDLRQFYARDHIDWLYRIDPSMPIEKFTEYWRDMTDVSFNATTGNTTLYIYAFTAEDTKAIADAVLKVSEKLVNELSESNRQQVMQVASKQVDRSEERLRKVQGEIRKLRIEEKVTDPSTLISLQNEVTRGLQSQLSTMKTRLSALLKSVDKDAPNARALQKQIDAIQAQLTEHEAQLGTTNSGGKPSAKNDDANMAEVLNKFEELTIEQNFATQAYTTALAAFETAIAEAQKQERYFATFVSPTRPEIALYPLRWLDSFIAFLVLLAVWMVSQFLYRSFRDHAI